VADRARGGARKQAATPTIVLLGSGNALSRCQWVRRLCGQRLRETRRIEGRQPYDGVSLGGREARSCCRLAAEFVRINVESHWTMQPNGPRAKQTTSVIIPMYSGRSGPVFCGTGLVCRSGAAWRLTSRPMVQHTICWASIWKLLRDLTPESPAGWRFIANVGNSASMPGNERGSAAHARIGLKLRTRIGKRSISRMPSRSSRDSREALYVLYRYNRIRPTGWYQHLALGARLPTMLSNRSLSKRAV